MKWNQRILQYLCRRIIERNEQFKDRHKGETCYIIGNGSSLKNMDLSVFADRISIGLNFLCIHRDFHKLNSPYYVIPAPKFFYPYYENPYSKKIQLNSSIKAFKKAISLYPDINLFTSITNFFATTKVKKSFYIHHFGHNEPDRNACDISGNFSFMAGGLHAGIGVAINLGFKKAILVGCDYLFTPTQEMHFYTAGPPIRGHENHCIYEQLLRESKGLIELCLITDKCESKWLPFQTYESYAGEKIRYRENTDIVDDTYLQMFNRAFQKGLYSNAIYMDDLTTDKHK